MKRKNFPRQSYVRKEYELAILKKKKDKKKKKVIQKLDRPHVRFQILEVKAKAR